MIHAWLPPGFVPPQVTVVSVKPVAEVMMRGLGPTVGRVQLNSDDVLYWRSDIL